MSINISFFVYSDAAVLQQTPKQGEQISEPLLMVQNPTYVFRPPFVPCLYTFSISLSIFGFDTSADHYMQLKFYKSKDAPALAETEVISLPVVNDQTPSNLPAYLKGAVFSVDFRNVQLRENGTYFTDLFFDDQLIGTFPINVWGKE